MRGATLLLLALGGVGLAAPARAGDRPLDVLLVNMTAAPTEAGRACSQTLRRTVRADYTRMSTLGETRLREALGAPEGDFLTWPSARFTELRRDRQLDTVVLFDCRPEETRFDALVVADGGRTRLSLRRLPFDRARARWLGGRILAAGWL
ncbi:MAG: hypothetical protein AAGH15_13610, partial [Myxococcota bacterium]